MTTTHILTDAEIIAISMKIPEFYSLYPIRESSENLGKQSMVI